MTTLHILHVADLPDALARLWTEGDALLLSGAAVTLACRPGMTLPRPCLALDDALKARGLLARTQPGIEVIGMADWVGLVASHARSLSWS